VEHFTREQLLQDLQRFAYHGVVAVHSMGADRREIAWPLRGRAKGDSGAGCEEGRLRQSLAGQPA
jgi:hypothetical protein